MTGTWDKNEYSYDVVFMAIVTRSGIIELNIMFLQLFYFMQEYSYIIDTIV